MNIRVNGQARDVQARTVAELLAIELPATERPATERPIAEGTPADIAFVAVALNDAVVPRRDWGHHPLAAGDRVEIVQPVRGG